MLGFYNLHESNGYFEHVVLKGKFGESAPEAACLFLNLLTCVEQELACVIELRHSWVRLGRSIKDLEILVEWRIRFGQNAESDLLPSRM